MSKVRKRSRGNGIALEINKITAKHILIADAIRNAETRKITVVLENSISVLSSA